MRYVAGRTRARDSRLTSRLALRTLGSGDASRLGRNSCALSVLATGSGKTISRLVDSQDITIRRIERAFQYSSDHWPDGLEWTGDIPWSEAALAGEEAV